MIRWFALLICGACGTTYAQQPWTVDFASPGVTAHRNVSESFLISGAIWDTDGNAACPPAGADDVRCEWSDDHVAGDVLHGGNGIIAVELDGSASQRGVFLSDVWPDSVNAGAIWWVNYDVHFVALDPADLPSLRAISRFEHAGTNQLTLTLDGNAGTARIQHRIAPQHNWFETPETGNEWQIRLTLRRTAAGQPAMIWVDNLVITEGPATLYSETFPLIPGDVNGDCGVDLSDLATLLSNFGLGAAARDDGDLDGDGDVDLSDLSELLANFGAGCP